jgi:hypothetical protein
VLVAVPYTLPFTSVERVLSVIAERVSVEVAVSVPVVRLPIELVEMTAPPWKSMSVEVACVATPPQVVEVTKGHTPPPPDTSAVQSSAFPDASTPRAYWPALQFVPLPASAVAVPALPVHAPEVSMVRTELEPPTLATGLDRERGDEAVRVVVEVVAIRSAEPP